MEEDDMIIASNQTDLEDIYVDFEVTTGSSLRTVPEPPSHYHPIAKTLHQYFLGLFYEIEDFFFDHWGWFLIGFGLFILLVIIPGIVVQIYCDRLYRKFKREQITRKILEYEAQMEKDSEASDDDEFKRASSRAQKKEEYYSDSTNSSSSSEEDRRSRGRGRSRSKSRSKSQKRNKTGKKVRSHSRPKRKHRTQSSDESELSGDMKHEVQVKFVQERKQKSNTAPKEKELTEGAKGIRKTKSTGVNPLPLYEDHVDAEKRFAELRKQRDSGVSMWDAESNSDYYSEPTGQDGTLNSTKFGMRYNDPPPVYPLENRPHSAAITAVTQFPTMTTTQNSSTLDSQTMPQTESFETTLRTDIDQAPFNSMKATGIQASLPNTHEYIPKLREEPLKPSDHRVGYWSAGIVNQYNGVRTPPLPAKMKHVTSSQATKNIAAVQGAAPITYEEIRLTKQHQTHDPKKRQTKEPADYNAALLRITQQNDDILNKHRTKTGPIIHNLMPVPSPKEPGPTAPPALPPKTKSGLKTVSRCPSMELNRTMHKDSQPLNQFDDELIENVHNIKVNRANI